jgi:hypothetical protein
MMLTRSIRATALFRDCYRKRLDDGGLGRLLAKFRGLICLEAECPPFPATTPGKQPIGASGDPEFL